MGDDLEHLIKRKEELYGPIHQQILMTDTKTDVILLAVNMCESSLRIFMEEYGYVSTKSIVEDMINKIVVR